MARRWAAAAVTCLATALLAGCSGGVTQASTTLPTTSAPAATAASPTLPPLGPPDFPVPAEARAKTPTGVKAFANYYLDLSNHLLNSLDSAPLRALSRHCSDCDSMADGYDKARAAGYRITGGLLTITSTGSSVVNGDAGELSFVLHQDAISVHDRSDALVASLSSNAFDLSGGMTMAWDAEHATWLVTQYTADRL